MTSKKIMMLDRYLAYTFFVNFMFLLLVLLSVVYLFDTVELLRRAAKRPDITFSFVFQMSFYKLPDVGQKVFPFAVLFASIFTFWQMTRRYELIVIRAAGFSAWQFLKPVVLVSVVIGLFQIMVINPVSSMMISRFEAFEVEYLGQQKSAVSLTETGLWLRQDRMDGEKGSIIIHADYVDLPSWQMRDVSVLYFGPAGGFRARIDAKTAVLEQGRWILQNLAMNEPKQAPVLLHEFEIPTKITRKEIEESYASPETLSFWRLPGFIHTLENTGLPTAKLRVHFYSLLAQPALFAAMVLLAACVSLRPPRQSGALAMVGIGVIFGFAIFFVSSFLQALGASQQIPAFLSAWSPAVISMLLGISILLNMEDG